MPSHLPAPSDGASVSPSITYDETCSFVHPMLVEAFEYWKAQCAGRQMPLRTDIHPAGMRPFLVHVSLVDVRVGEHGALDYFVRLAGSEVERVLGRRSGKMLLDGVPADQTERWRTPFDRVRESGRPLRSFGRLLFRGKTWLNSENMFAPLGGQWPLPTAMLCAFAATSATGGD
jgi:hypothetical protein